jgi:hypothetical protein
MDLDTLFTTVYVVVDDWYKQQMDTGQPKGRPCRMSDSEVLTLGIVGQWRVGVPWASERGLVRYIQAHGRGWFPSMLQVSGFNYRFRRLWGCFVRLQQVFAQWLSGPEALYEVVDSLPLPAYSLLQGRQRRQRHWLWLASLGYSKSGWFWGHRWLVSVTAQGVITGWVVAQAQVQDRWLLQALLSGRRLGFTHLITPPSVGYVKPKRRLHLPIHPIGPTLATGGWTARFYLADPAFGGENWRQHWRQRYRAEVISLPANNAPQLKQWRSGHGKTLSHYRQIIETVFATLTDVFAVKRLAVHSSWGQYARLAAIAAAHNLGIWLNRRLGRPGLALATLIL